MPSETEMVPNSSGYPPAEWTPSLAAWASRWSDRLQGVISFHELATPIWGFAKSSSPRPTARSIPREAVASMPSVTVRERGLMSMPGAAARPAADPKAGSEVTVMWASLGLPRTAASVQNRGDRGVRRRTGSVLRSVARLPRADADLVALGIREDPERRRPAVADQVPACGDC